MSCRRWCRSQQSELREFVQAQVYGRNRGEAKVCMATLHPQPSLSECPARDFFDAKAVSAHVSYRAALPRVEKLHREIALVGLANHVVAGILTVSTSCHLCHSCLILCSKKVAVSTGAVESEAVPFFSDSTHRFRRRKTTPLRKVPSHCPCYLREQGE